MHKGKLLSILVTVALLVTALSAPAAAQEDTTLTVWGFVWTADWLESIAADFEAAHPGVTVEVVRFEYEAYLDAIVTSLASGEEVPDVATLDPMWAGDLIRDGAVVALDGIEEDLNPEDFFGGWELCGYNGKQYGVPADLDFNLVFYRTDIYGPAIEEAGLDGFPVNTEQFLAVAQAISNDEQAAILLRPNDYYTWYQGFLVPYGGHIYNEDFTGYRLNEPEAVEALKFYSDLANVYNVALLWNDEVDGDPVSVLKEGEVLAIMQGSWYATELEAALPEMEGMWGVAPMPFGPEDREYHSAAGGACFSIPVAADDQDLAYDFLVYMEDPEVMATYYDVVGGVPSLTTAWEFTDLNAVNEYFGVALGQQVAEWSEGVVGMELPSSETAEALGEAMYMVIMEDMDPQEALDAAVEASPPLE